MCPCGPCRGVRCIHSASQATPMLRHIIRGPAGINQAAGHQGTPRFKAPLRPRYPPVQGALESKVPLSLVFAGLALERGCTRDPEGCLASTKAATLLCHSSNHYQLAYPF
jgi:hypothetical protein